MVRKKQPGMADLVQTNTRLPPLLVDDLDEIAREMNAAVGWNKFTRSDVVRDLLVAGVAQWKSAKSAKEQGTTVKSKGPKR